MFLEMSIKVKEIFFFDIFLHKIGEKNSLTVKTSINTHCCTYCLIFSSFQLMCSTLKHAESAKIEVIQKFTRKFVLSQKFSVKIFSKEPEKLQRKRKCIYCFVFHPITSTGMHIWVNRPEKSDLPCQKIWVFKYFWQKQDPKIFVHRTFRPGQLQSCQLSDALIEWNQ